MEIIYLAGGFRSNWQKEVKQKCSDKNFKWEDPFIKERGPLVEKENWTAEEYTQLDLHMIRKSSVVFAYLEKSNPGLGTIAECGYAVGLGKTVILVREKPHEVHKDRYLDFLEEICTISFNNLNDGITYLKSFEE